MDAVKDYTVHIDSKKRVTLRGAAYQYYNVISCWSGPYTQYIRLAPLFLFSK